MLEKIVNSPVAVGLGILIFVIFSLGVHYGWTVGLNYFTK